MILRSSLLSQKLKNVKDDIEIVAIVAKRKFDSEPYDSFVE